jgi:hypothetical protein
MQAFEIRLHQVLLELIKEERNKEATFLAEGKALDWGDYQRRVGILEGLARARQLADQLAHDAVRNEESTKQLMREHQQWQT